MYLENQPQNKPIQEEIKSLAEFFLLLYEVDKRVNPEYYEKCKRNTNNPDKSE